MDSAVRPYDIGCEPSPSVPAETLLQDGWCTYLLFFAVSKAVGKTGYLEDLRVAVLNCTGCVATRFGYPNDEGRPEHPLITAGLLRANSSVLEVADSPWCIEVEAQMEASARRIRGSQPIGSRARRSTAYKHFIILLKEATFECVAESLKVEQFARTFDDAFVYVQQRMKAR